MGGGGAGYRAWYRDALTLAAGLCERSGDPSVPESNERVKCPRQVDRLSARQWQSRGELGHRQRAFYNIFGAVDTGPGVSGGTRNSQ